MPAEMTSAAPDASETPDVDAGASVDTTTPDTSSSVESSELASAFESAIADEPTDTEPGESAPAPAARGDQPASPQAQTPAPQQPADDWTTQDFQYAAAFGINPSELQAFKSPSHFRAYINAKAEMQRQPQQRQQAFAPQPFQLPGDPSQYDESFVGLVNHFNQQLSAMHQHYGSQVGAVQNQFGQFLPHIQQLMQQQEQKRKELAYTEFDRVVDELDEDLVGRGDFSALSSPEHQQARKAIASRVQALELWHRQQGDAMPPMKELVEQAFHGLFHRQIAAKRAKQLSVRANGRLQSTTAAPSRATSSSRGTDADLTRQWSAALKS